MLVVIILERETRGSLGQSVRLTCWPISQPSGLGKFLASERPCLKNKKNSWTAPESGCPRPSSASAHMCSCTHRNTSFTYVYTYNLMAYIVLLWPRNSGRTHLGCSLCSNSWDSCIQTAAGADMSKITARVSAALTGMTRRQEPLSPYGSVFVWLAWVLLMAIRLQGKSILSDYGRRCNFF